MSASQTSESHIRALVEALAQRDLALARRDLALAQRDRRIAALEQQATDIRTIGGRTCVIIGDHVLAYDEAENQTGGVIGRIVMDDPARRSD